MKKISLLIITVSLMFSIGACDNNTTSNNDPGSGADLSYTLVETGQSECYNSNGEVIVTPVEGDSLFGQDANYLYGADFAFVDDDDGTVTDNNTGLMWEQIPSPDGFSYQDAIEYCENLELAGYDDWRLPSLKELFSISDFGTGWPYIDLDYFELATGQITKDEQYWTSNEYEGITVEGGEDAVFGVNHVTGHIKAYPGVGGAPLGQNRPEPPQRMRNENSDMSRDGGPPPDPFSKQVRAVRGDIYGTNEFVDNGDGTITDNATGLMWSQIDNGEGIDWENALAYAENSEYADFTDWRLPNVKELQSIVDYSYAPGASDPALDRAAIDPLFTCTQIINEAGDDDYPYYWTSTSALFESGGAYYYAWYVAFGRAVNGEGLDFHGAGAVRFDTKVEGGPAGEGGERYYNYVRLVRDVNQANYMPS